MIDLSHYIKAKSIADTYINNYRYLNGTMKKQHFMSRLSLCNGYKNLLSDNRKKLSVFKYTTQDLTKKLSQSWGELWDDSIKNDGNGYKEKIKNQESGDIKFYFGMTDILGEASILLRNKLELPKGIEKKINRHNLIKMIDIANDDVLIKDLEGTTYVNGIGGIICLKKLKNSLIPIAWDTIDDCYKKIFEYYLDKYEHFESWMDDEFKRHNYIYGLTHCIINLTNFYTEFIQNNDKYMTYIRRTILCLKSILKYCKRNNYQLLNNDTLAEILLTMKLCGGEYETERIAAVDSLSLRFDPNKHIFREHKFDSFKDEILKNEHTNILYILNVLF